MTSLTRQQLKKYDQACNKLGQMLNKASTLMPNTANAQTARRTSLSRKITDDSVERFVDANFKNRGRTKADDALEQAFETVYQKQAHARRQFVNVPRGRVKVLEANIRGIVSELKSYGRADRIGKTAKKIFASIDDIRKVKLTGLKSDTAFAKKVDKALELLLVTHNRHGGYTNIREINASSASRTQKAAMTAVFKYLANSLGMVRRTGPNGQATEADYARAQVCVDQRARAHVMMLRLQDADSPTMKAIMKLKV